MQAAVTFRGLRSDIHVDMRGFHDPAHDRREVSRHTGSSVVIQTCILGHERYVPWAEDLIRRVAHEARQEGEEPLRVTMMCRAGRHRSVAGAHIMARLFHELGYTTLEPIHWEQPAWPTWLCHRACDQCTSTTPRQRCIMMIAVNHARRTYTREGFGAEGTGTREAGGSSWQGGEMSRLGVGAAAVLRRRGVRAA